MGQFLDRRADFMPQCHLKAGRPHRAFARLHAARGLTARVFGYFQSYAGGEADRSKGAFKTRVRSCEQAESRPVKPGPSARDQADETVMDEACSRHWHCSAFRLGKRQAEILDR